MVRNNIVTWGWQQMNIDRLISHVTSEPTDCWQLPSALSRDEIEQIVQHLKDEADRHWYIDPNISLQFAEKIITLWRTV